MSDDLIKRIAGHILQADRYGSKYEGTGMGLIFDSHSRLFKESSDEIERLREENKRLRKVLKPFDRYLEHYSPSEPDNTIVAWSGANPRIELGDLRHARSALSSDGGSPYAPYNNNLDYLSARESTLMAMIRRLSPEDVMARTSLEGELESVRDELKKVLGE